MGKSSIDKGVPRGPGGMAGVSARATLSSTLNREPPEAGPESPPAERIW